MVLRSGSTNKSESAVFFFWDSSRDEIPLMFKLNNDAERARDDVPEICSHLVLLE